MEECRPCGFITEGSVALIHSRRGSSRADRSMQRAAPDGLRPPRATMVDEPKIELFVKSSEDGESIGANPFSQRLAMILMFKKCTFTLNTVDMKRAPDVLKDLAPGSQPPFLTYNSEVKTDVNKIEEFLEENLTAPQYPCMTPKYKESNTAGNDVFHKFSSYIKNQSPAQEDNLQKSLLRALLKLDMFLKSPLPHELASDPKMVVSKRKYLDGDNLTLPDCNLLPKLHIINVVCRHYRNFEIPKDLQGISRYLHHAEELKAFKYTCPNPNEIILFYRDVVKKMP